MHVLLALHHYLDPNQGAPGATLALGTALQSLGCEVEYYDFGVAFRRQGNYVYEAIQFPGKLSHFLTRNADRFDVIDASTGDAWLWAKLSRPGAKGRHALITRSHGLEHTVHANLRQDAKSGAIRLSWKYPFYNGGYRLWEVATSLRQADMALLLNQHDHDFAVTKLGVKPDRARIVAMGLLESFIGRPFQRDNQGVPAPLQLAQIGSYIKRKGIVYGCQALNKMLARHKQMTITFLGTGCSEAQVLADFDTAVRAQVHVVPHFSREKLPDLLEGHRILLFPSLCEGFSTALPEGMACGLAPIATAIPGNVEIVRNEENALLIPPRDSNAIEQALERLISDRALLERLRYAAYTTAQLYGWRRIASETLAIYEEALKRRST